MEKSVNIDWISATYPTGYNDNKWQTCVLPQEHREGVPSRPMNGYTLCYKYPSGASLQMNSDRPDMGIHVTYSAKAIAKSMTEFDCTQGQLLHFLMRGAKITRLDVCYDIPYREIDIRELYHDAQRGNIKTRSKSIGYVESSKIGKEEGAATLYIGSQKNRKKLLRVYDKGSQLDLNHYLTRFELEQRGIISDNAAKLLKAQDLDDYGKVIVGMIKSFADFKDTSVGDLFEVDKVPVKVPQFRNTDTASWLINIVAPTLAKEMFHEQSVYFDFIDKVKFEYQILADEYSKKDPV